MSSSQITPNQSAVTPIQSIQFTQADMQDPNLGLFNSYLNSIVNSHNGVLGANGQPTLPAGINVAGGSVTGLAAPTDPSDAISASHADSQYSAAAVKSQLDIGGSSALPGLTLLWMKVNKLSNQTSTFGQNNVTGSRTLGGGPYQNTSAGLMFVTGAGQVHSGSGDSILTCKVGPTSPTVEVYANTITGTIANEPVGFSFVVPPGYFYAITGTNLITATPHSWVETILM